MKNWKLHAVALVIIVISELIGLIRFNVGPGTVITASIAGLEERFLLGSREAAEDIEGIEVYPEGAPLGQAIMGLKAGDKTSFKAPNGRSIPVEVIKIESFEG